MRLSKRISILPDYFFAELNKLKREKGDKLIDFSVGDPDIPTDKRIVDKLKASVEKKEYHRYSPYEGFYFLREEIAKWYKKRFGISLNADKNVLVLIGSKEGIAHIPYCFVDKGDYVIVPTPSFPVYKTASLMAGAKIFEILLKEKNNFLPLLSEIPERILRKTKIFFLNYPNNPTGKSTDKNFYREIIKLAMKYDFLVINDFVYSEIYYKEPPSSIFEIENSYNYAIEFHSFSKTFNMAGWRLGFCVGNEIAIKTLLKFKSGIDSSQFGAIQDAGAFAFSLVDEITEKMRKIYENRKNKLLLFLNEKQIKYFEPEAGIYIWAKIPKKYKDSMEWTLSLLKEKDILVAPGDGFGKGGKGFFRISLTVPEKEIDRAIKRFE